MVERLFGCDPQSVSIPFHFSYKHPPLVYSGSPAGHGWKKAQTAAWCKPGAHGLLNTIDRHQPNQACIQVQLFGRLPRGAALRNLKGLLFYSIGSQLAEKFHFDLQIQIL
jgi:hypothetical protein